MNPVNLLPPKHRPRTPSGGQQGSAYIVVGALGVLLVLVLFYVLTVNGVNSHRDQVAKAKAETAQAQARATSLSSYGDFSKIKEQRVQSVKQLAGGRIDWERLTRGLARVLPNEVWLVSASASASGTPTTAGASGSAPSTPSSDSTSGPAGPKAELVGCAPSQSVVAVTLARLRELAGATDVQLNEITRPEDPQVGGTASASSASAGSSGSEGDCGGINGHPASKWDATITFNENPGASSTHVPKSLGGGA